MCDDDGGPSLGSSDGKGGSGGFIIPLLILLGFITPYVVPNEYLTTPVFSVIFYWVSLGLFLGWLLKVCYDRVVLEPERDLCMHILIDNVGILLAAIVAYNAHLFLERLVVP